MFDEMSAYREILQAVQKMGGERLDGAAESVTFQLHSLLPLLSDDLRRREFEVMRVLARMKNDGIFDSAGSPPVYRSSQGFEKACHETAEEKIYI